MSGLKRWWLLACCLLAACATTQPIESTADGCEVASEAASFEQLCAEDGTLVVLCDERQCGAYRCREVVERLTAGRVVLARYPRPPLPTSPGQGSTSTQPSPLPSPGPGVGRYRGSAQGAPGDTQPVFIIPWSPEPKPKPELLPSQKQLLAEAEEYRKKPHEGHHIYPRAFQRWFTEQGIDIDAYILPLEVSEHRRIHQGANGGPWNEAWRKFIENNPKGPTEKIHRHAGQLIYEFGLFGPILPYKLWRLQPPSVQGP